MSFFELLFSILAHLAAVWGACILCTFISLAWVEFNTPQDIKNLLTALGKDYGGLNNISLTKFAIHVTIFLIGICYLLTEVYQVFN